MNVAEAEEFVREALIFSRDCGSRFGEAVIAERGIGGFDFLLAELARKDEALEAIVDQCEIGGPANDDGPPRGRLVHYARDALGEQA